MNTNTAAAKSAAKSALRTCRCGCEAPLGGKAAYRPGHDARHVSNLKAKLEASIASSDRSQEAAARIQEEVYTIFGQLKSTALRAKLGRAVDNDKEGLYNSFGDAGVYVPYSENPSLGGNGKDRWGRDMQATFEAAHPAEASKGKKAPKGAPAVADEPWITHEPVETPTAPEPMWEDDAPGVDFDEHEQHQFENQGDTEGEAFEVKIGRWVYPAKHLLGMDVRNTKRDGSGEWVPYTAS